MNSASFSISMSYAVPTALQLRLTNNPVLAYWARHMTSYRTQNTAYSNSTTLSERRQLRITLYRKELRNSRVQDRGPLKNRIR